MSFGGGKGKSSENDDLYDMYDYSIDLNGGGSVGGPSGSIGGMLELNCISCFYL